MATMTSEISTTVLDHGCLLKGNGASFSPTNECSRLEDPDWESQSPNLVDLSAWEKVNAERKDCGDDEHRRFWWSQHVGKTLAVLLQNAGYPEDVQHRDLTFFAQVIAPHLGIARKHPGDSGHQWFSFMTDDGNPAEMSWDWGSNGTSPKIRYSIEPIGLEAGTKSDPNNLRAGPSLQRQLLESLPDMRLAWYYHFLEFFNVPGGMHGKDESDHNTTIFYAFDLAIDSITTKVYYFPKFRAHLLGQSNLDVLSDAIHAAPYSTVDNLKAWKSFYDFSSRPENQGWEHEMLAIDLIDPLTSRLKIYFRCRETTFDSVINIVTHGGQIKDPKLYRGLIDLARLWNAIFEVDMPLDRPLGEADHRTAGILYNIEFKLGDTLPVTKLYLPVRHYSRSDHAIIQGLDKYFRYSKNAQYMPAYVKTMNALFSPEVLTKGTGAHTYIGVSILPNGRLRVVSYFKTDVPHFLLQHRKREGL